MRLTALLLWARPSSPDSKGVAMTEWEYFVTPLPPHTPGVVLNNLGKQGWELVQIVTGPAGGDVAYLKRPLASAGASNA